MLCTKTLILDVFGQPRSKLFYKAFLHLSPKIPSLNRWTKLFQPMVWWLMARSFFNIVTTAIIQQARPRVLDLQASHVDSVGMPNDDDFQVREALRFKKTEQWLTDTLTPLRLRVACVVMQVSNRLLGKFFKDH